MRKELAQARDLIQYVLSYSEDPSFKDHNKKQLTEALGHLKVCQDHIELSLSSAVIIKNIRDVLDQVELHINLGLTETAVIALDQLRDTILIENPTYQWAAIDDFIKLGKKIQAIKLYRDIHGHGLYESKIAIEKRAEYLKRKI